MSSENKMPLLEAAHIYVDDDTGDEYIFNGKKLVKISSGKPLDIGDKGNEEEERREDEEREKQIAKEREEDPENTDQEETEEERKERLDKIKQFLDDQNVSDQIKNDSETKVQDEKKRKKAATEREIRKNLKGAEKNSAVIKDLSKDLQKFLAKQVGTSQRTASWKKYNGNYDNSGIVKQGYRYEKIGKIPVIQIYIDQSGSWTETDVKIGRDILNSIIEFERKKLIKTETYYFSNHIHSNPSDARNEGGTQAGKELLDQLNATKPDNVIVITDDDFDYFRGDPNFGISSSYTAPGGVWLVFKGSASKDLMEALHGKLLTKYYYLDR